MIDRVWIVWGFAFVGDQERYWFVAAYPSEDVASLHASIANDAMEEIKDRLAGNSEEFVRDLLMKFPYDKFIRSRTATAELEQFDFPSYAVAGPPFCLHPDEYQDRFPVETKL